MPTKEVIEKIIQTFRRTKDKPPTSEWLEKLREENLKDTRDAIFICPRCKAILKWREPNRAIKEIRLPLRYFHDEKVRNICPKCGKPLDKTEHLKQHDYHHPYRDYEIVY